MWIVHKIALISWNTTCTIGDIDLEKYESQKSQTLKLSLKT